MKNLLTGAALVAAAVLTSASERTDALLAAHLAWDRGDYVAALSTYLQVIDSPAGDEMLEPIALQTGELFHTIELTADGSAPQFSADGRYISYEVGTGLERMTRVVSTAEPGRTVFELGGWGAAFAPDASRIAFIRLPPTPELDEARAAVDKAQPGAERVQRTAALAQLVERSSRIVVRDIATGRDIEIDTGSLGKSAVRLAADGLVLFTGSPGSGPTQIYIAGQGRITAPLTSDNGDKVLGALNAGGTHGLFTVRPPGGGRGAGRGGGRGGGDGSQTVPAFGLASLSDGRVTMITGTAPVFSGDGSAIAYIAREGPEYRLVTAPTSAPDSSTIVRKGPERLDAPAASHDASRYAVQVMARDDWEIVVVNRDGTGEARVTREIQHDLLPQFVTADRLLAVVGEPRHRRSYVYDLSAGTRTRLFHNNTVRTIAPEYSWAVNPEGTKVLISAERDGDTVSPARGVYLMDLSRKVTRAELRARVAANLAAEQALRATAAKIYAPIAAAVKAVVGDASVARVYGYQKALFDFDSKHISHPGNKLAAAYLFETYKSFGYEPQYQSFEAKNALDGRTANVLATLEGTVNPDLVYVVSSHFDSVAAGPGADDDSSGTAALLETARLLAKHPQPATIIFASFTGEEAGLLGSREFVRQAVAGKMQVVGALNNDMIGWANDHRLDNTIRYSNPGIRDVQHAAAMQFSNLITYDALYYKGTDAAAYYEAWGDIVGGIGSYPVLGNPHYHQAHDLLDTINHQLVTEVARTTAATLMLLASSPSRIAGLKVDSYSAGTATVSWTPSPETGVAGYLVAWGPPEKPEARQMRVAKATATLSKVPPGSVVSVKAVNAKGLEGWDWARVVVK